MTYKAWKVRDMTLAYHHGTLYRLNKPLLVMGEPWMFVVAFVGNSRSRFSEGSSLWVTNLTGSPCSNLNRIMATASGASASKLLELYGIEEVSP